MARLKKETPPNKRAFYALDVGSQKMALACAALVQPEGRLGDIIYETAPARGIFKGVVNDMALFSDAVRGIVRKMEGRLGQKITRLALSVNGNYVQSRHSVAAVALSERGTRSITKRDVERLNQQTRTLGLELDEHLLHQYPQGYSIDRHNMTLNPVGLHGRKLQEDLLLVCAPVSCVENIVRAVEQAGCDVIQCAYAGIAAGEAVLSDEEKETGAVLVDIGETLTGVVIYREGVVRHVSILPFGGKNISEIISNFCRVSVSVADELKRSSLELSSEEEGSEEILVKAEDAYRSVKKSDLVSAITPEMEGFFSVLKRSIFESGVENIQASKVSVVGGLSLLEGLLEKMERTLELPVRLGLPRGSQNFPLSLAPLCASAIGLLRMQLDDHRRSSFLFQAQNKGPFKRVSDYLTDLYHDYF